MYVCMCLYLICFADSKGLSTLRLLPKWKPFRIANVSMTIIKSLAGCWYERRETYYLEKSCCCRTEIQNMYGQVCSTFVQCHPHLPSYYSILYPLSFILHPLSSYNLQPTSYILSSYILDIDLPSIGHVQSSILHQHPASYILPTTFQRPPYILPTSYRHHLSTVDQSFTHDSYH
jgi:hypothetical protein